MEILDTSRPYETPEAIVLDFKLAGPVVRACAWAIDFIIRSVLYVALALLFSYFGGVGTAVIFIGVFLIEWFYPVLFEVVDGATPGKKMMGICVIHDNGTPVAWSSSLIRNLLRAVDFLPFFYGFGLVCMLFNRDFKRLGDLAAGTLVVYLEKPSPRIAIPEVQPRVPPAGLTIQEQRILLAYAERSRDLSPARRSELADHLTSLTGGRGNSGVKILYAWAAWIATGK